MLIIKFKLIKMFIKVTAKSGRYKLEIVWCKENFIANWQVNHKIIITSIENQLDAN